MEKRINYTLPEFAFLDANTHLGNLLDARDVVLHVRTASVLEIINTDDKKEIHLKEPTYKFTYTNFLGVDEHFMVAVHYTFAEDDDMPEIIERLTTWYKAYMDWEDKNIMNEETGKIN